MIVAGAFVSLDGVMQAPGGPNEDPTGGFELGGWGTTHWDDVLGAAMGETFAAPFDLLLGRRTYDIFAAHWPHVEHDPAASAFDKLNSNIARTFDRITKYVATSSPETLTWRNSRGLGDDVVEAVGELKRSDGPVLLIQGSTMLIQALLANDLIDEIRLQIFRKRLFGEGTVPAAFRLARSAASPSGVLIASYTRAGEVTTGSFAMEVPTEAELERRRRLAEVGWAAGPAGALEAARKTGAGRPQIAVVERLLTHIADQS